MNEPGPRPSQSLVIYLSNLPTEVHRPKNSSFLTEWKRQQWLISSWFKIWPWLQYIENDDAVIYIMHEQASTQKKL